MLSRREVSIRILALLQRKTLIETKNRTLKCLKWHYLTVRSQWKMLECWRRTGALALFFRPHPGGFDSSRVPTPGNLPSKAKKMLMPGGQPRGGAGRRWNWLMHKEHTQGDLWLSPCLQLFRSFYACFQTTCIVLSELASMGRNGEQQ